MQVFKVLILVGLLLASLLEGTEASARAGRASPYAAKFRRSKDNICGITKKSIDRRFVQMYAALSADDASASDACGKCLMISGMTATTSRRFSPGVFAKIVDIKDTITSGEILLSRKAMKVTSKGSSGDIVSWTVVDCPSSTNLRRGRKSAEKADTA